VKLIKGETKMSFNTADLLVTRHGSKSLTKGCEEITIEGVNVPTGYWKTKPSEQAPLYKLVYRKQFGVHLEPVNKPEGVIGPMANGVYADVGSNFIKKTIEIMLGYPCPDLIPVHDRFETQEMYNMLSR
tara:strand:- start:92 stop:478 length:387 start_codon:yes stop_codon:yes gene_type:complete